MATTAAVRWCGYGIGFSGNTPSLVSRHRQCSLPHKELYNWSQFWVHEKPKGLAVKPSQRDQNVEELRSFPLPRVIYLKIDKKSILSSSSKALPVSQKNDRLPIRHAWESVECRFSSGLFEKPSRTRQDIFFGLMLSASSCTKMNLPQPIVFFCCFWSPTQRLTWKTIENEPSPISVFDFKTHLLGYNDRVDVEKMKGASR